MAVVIGSNGVHFVRIKHVAGRPQVKSYTFWRLSGVKVAAMTPATLDKLRKDAHVPELPVSTLLAAGEYQLILTEAPNVPQEEMKSAVRWSVKDNLNYHVDDAVLDVLSIPAGNGERSKSLYVVAAARDVVSKRIELFKRAHMKLAVIDIPEMAQRNIAALYEQNGRALALLSLDESGGLLTFSCDGELYMARRIEISAGQLNDANETLRLQYTDRLELELQRSIDHFDRQFKHVTVNRLLLSVPDNAALAGTLGNALGLPIEALDLREVMDMDGVPELAHEEARVYALHALGAALRQEGHAL